MPKPAAIKLSSKTIPRICDELDISVRDLEMELNQPGVDFYYVKDCLFQGSPMRYLIYRESDFLEDFASVPPGIETDFVPVTQVKD